MFNFKSKNLFILFITLICITFAAGLAFAGGGCPGTFNTHTLSGTACHTTSTTGNIFAKGNTMVTAPDTMRWIGIYKLTCRDKAGNVVWTEYDHNALTDEGEHELLDVYMRGATQPTSFYLRLYNDTPVETDSLTDLTGEPSGFGYSPIQVTADATGFPIGGFTLDSGDWQVTTQTVTFQSSGGTIGPVTSCVLATSSDNTGKLITFAALSQSRTLADGESLDVTYKVKLQ